MKAALVKSTSHALYTFHFHSPACIISLQCKFLHSGSGAHVQRASRNTFLDTENGSSRLNGEQNNAILFTEVCESHFFRGETKSEESAEHRQPLRLESEEASAQQDEVCYNHLSSPPITLHL